MAITQPVFKLAFGGRLFANEQWTCALHFSGIDTDARAELFAPMLNAWFNRAGSNINTHAKLDYIKWNEINPVTGLYANESASDTYILPVPATGTVAGGPGQLSLAITTTTALQRGRGSKGRFYPPTGATVAATDASGQCDSQIVTASLLSAKTLVMDLAAEAAISCVIYSKVGQLVQPVTGLKVGRIADTQRRRRYSLSENYEVATFA